MTPHAKNVEMNKAAHAAYGPDGPFRDAPASHLPPVSAQTLVSQARIALGIVAKYAPRDRPLDGRDWGEIDAAYAILSALEGIRT